MASWRRADLKAGGLAAAGLALPDGASRWGGAPESGPFGGLPRAACAFRAATACPDCFGSQAAKTSRSYAQSIYKAGQMAYYLPSVRVFVRALSVELEVGSPPTLCREGWMVESTWYAHHRRIVRL
jgi:hypothetical protein